MQHITTNAAWVRRFILAFMLAVGLMLPYGAQAIEPKATFKDWRLFVSRQNTIKSCYIVGEPRTMQPRTARRGAVFLSVSHRPAQGVRGEVNVQIGYPFSASSNPFAKIGADEFSFFTGVQAQNGADEAAWLIKLKQQPRMVRAMKRGTTLIFKGTSARGTLTTDRYSLRGFTAAMRAMDAACPKR